MEFETNKPPTEQDLTLAHAERMTLQPVHTLVEQDSPGTHVTANSAATMKLESETESTTVAAALSQQQFAHPHRLIAILLAAAIIAIFGGFLAAIYLLR